MRVLMVDDSAADRKVYRALLESGQPDPNSLEVLEASGASEGLELCRSAAPDCVLLDDQLPAMTGLEFLARLTGDPPSEVPLVAVVMLTGVESEKTAVAALRAGAHDYLSKDQVNAENLSMAVEKATQRVALLRTLKAERDRLSLSLAQKEVLLQEVHHRVKNNLAVIVSLLRLQAGSFTDPRLHAALLESQTRVETMAMIHEQLYQARDHNPPGEDNFPHDVDLASHVSQLAANLFYCYGVNESRIRLQVDLPPLHLPVDRAIPAGLILNELISNSLKHAFPDGRHGAIVITGKSEYGRVILWVRDDGVGVDAADAEHGTSAGLQIVDILTRQLKGQIESVNFDEKHRGAGFRIEFPVS